MQVKIPAFIMGMAGAVTCTASPALADIVITPVRVPFIAGETAAEDFTQREVARGVPIVTQRLTALKSVTLQEDVSVKSVFGAVELFKGVQLVVAVGDNGANYFCGSHTPADLPRWASGGKYARMWSCLEDRDQDGRFDYIYSASGFLGAIMPSFTGIYEQKPVSAAYLKDSDEDRYYYDTAIVHQNSFNLNKLLYFFIKIKPKGEVEWIHSASSPQGVVGHLTNIPSSPLPADVILQGFKLTVIEKTKNGVIVKPISAPKGIRSFGMSQHRLR